MSLAAKALAWLRWLRRSFILRLTLLLSAIFALGMALAILIAIGLGREAILTRADAALDGLAASLAAGSPVAETAGAIIRPMDALGDLPPQFGGIAKEGGGAIDLKDEYRGSEDWRVAVARDAAGAPVLIAVSLEDSEDALELLEGILWSVAIVVLVAALAVGLGAGLLAERRLSRIAAVLTRLAAGDLGARTGLSREVDDLDDLARRVDATAGEVERLVTQTRHLSASLAHDLRTPLARLRARLETLPDGDERDAAIAEAARLSEIFDTIMRVARIEATHGMDGLAAVDLAEFAGEIAETFGPVVEDADKTLRLDAKKAGVVRADRRMLVQAMANLIQNALVHGGAEIVLFAQGAEIGVRDDGPGVESAQFDEIIRPMVRLDAARNTEGSGLGLALVRAVADRHGAALTLSQNDPQGLCVALKFTDL